MIHWDPEGKTALANEEVIYHEEEGKLYYIAYKIVGSAERIVIATTRPETILADSALCVHPEDKRYEHLHGKSVYVPLIDRVIPIIADPYVDPSFGSGCLKVTPAHDPNDYLLSQKHNLPIINILTQEGKLNEEAQRYIGVDRMVARSQIIADLKAAGQVVKVVPHTHKVGRSERTGAIVEPRISIQWFVRMKKLAQPAIEAVLNGTITFHPAKFVNTYMAWMENIKDWCISRQLWWGQQIPIYYLSDGRFVAAESPEEALEKARALTGDPQLPLAALTQDPDVLDTWFSSWLWPISIFEGTLDPTNPDYQYYYPTHDLVTAPEIIFFWVARMIMAGYKFTGQAPFSHVYFTGIVRDRQRRKMSKSLGNSPDPLMLIKRYGADGVRAGMLFCAPAGNDLLFEEKHCQQGDQFAHKIKHAHRLIKQWIPDQTRAAGRAGLAVEWFEARLAEAIHAIRQSFAEFKLSEALLTIYRLIWDDFCASYLALIKPREHKAINAMVYERTVVFFEELLKLLHPFMPFITEEIWHQLRPRVRGESITIAAYPAERPFDKELLAQARRAFQLISKVRQFKNKQQISLKEPIPLLLQGAKPTWLARFENLICQSAYITTITSQVAKPAGHTGFVVDNLSFWLSMPQGDLKDNQQQLSQELARQERLLAAICANLSNAQFLAKAAPAVVQREKQKEVDTQARITTLQKLLAEENA